MNDIVTFKDEQLELEVNISPEEDTVWLSLDQLSDLFDKNKSTISRHIKNIFSEGELDSQVVVAKFATTTQHGAIAGKTQSHITSFYNLDVIISVGYRVKSPRGVLFRKWATNVLRQYFPIKIEKTAISSGFQRLLIWSGRRDSNSRPLVPETSALPNCATPRHFCVAR